MHSLFPEEPFRLRNEFAQLLARMREIRAALPTPRPTAQALATRAMATRAFTHWAFDHFLMVAPPEFARVGSRAAEPVLTA